jgi:hypothetical protein
MGETALCSETYNGSALGNAPTFASGCVWGGKGPPCSGITPATVLHVASTHCKPHPSLPLHKDAIEVEEEERQWADRVLEQLKNVGGKQMVV